MERKNKIIEFIKISLLIINLLGILGLFVYVGYENKHFENQNPPKIENTSKYYYLSDDVKDALIDSYYDYIDFNCDSLEFKKYWDIRNSKVTMP